ncbi:alpha/beta fold hydrolase [Flavobacterium crassostreae]|uniref:Alpha/beta hydrolase n=1 Tax=Flavobacterium crassostreae TaxID=1763534 RepID=A0A1B9E5X4_9FLAO|nr:alpha/beta hydrolase [Flavobacterium crassostreae]OCB77335.1 alpha/beta hydrolase [Flavobacterium crassostreae]
MRHLQFKNTDIAYTDTGKGAAIVLLHGFLENQKMWDAYIAVFAQKYRIITIDLLGHGQTECMGYVHTMEDNADVVHAVLTQLRIRRAVLVGHSMGGYVALAFADLYPETIKGLVLLNSTARADSPDRKQNRDRAIRAVKQNYRAFVGLAIANLFSENNQKRLIEEIENIKKEALKTPLQAIVATLEGMKTRVDREVLLHNTSFPKMLVLGKKDPILGFEETKTQVENTKVELVGFSDGHMSSIENQEELMVVLGAFFKKI